MTQPVHELIADNHYGKVLTLLRRVGDLTDFEIADKLGMFLSSVNAARNWLVKQGYVVATDQKRPSGRGGMATVWTAVTQ